jgi:PiT family inorganic phosphate transporter
MVAVAFTTLLLAVIIIFIALIFDFTNGFHDSANAIATVVSTKVLSPKQAVMFAAFFNFIAAFALGTAVADTIGSIIVRDNVPSMDILLHITLAAVIGAITWNLITWYLGLPTSSSHALIGGLIGAGFFAAGLAAIKSATVFKVVLFMILSPIIGLVIGFFFMACVMWACRKSSQAKVDKHFRRLQLVSAGAYSFSHGLNDAQKTMGVIILVLIGAGLLNAPESGLPTAPMWVIFAAYTAIALGTLVGGWRIVRTMGHRITKLRPVHGFSAETASAVTIIGASAAAIPVSTTHIISTSIMGVGATKRVSAVRWGVARKIVWAWVITIPASALIGGLAYEVIRLFA